MTNKKDFSLVASSLIDELIRDISGENEEYLFGSFPSDKVLIGKISANNVEKGFIVDEVKDNERFESIPSIGLRFRLPKNAEKIFIKLKGKLFYRVEPTYEQQIEYMCKKYSSLYSKNINNLDALKAYFNSLEKDANYKEDYESIVKTYKSFNLEELGEFEIDLGNWENSISDLNLEIKDKITSFVDSISDKSILIGDNRRKISFFFDKENFESMKKSKILPFKPKWEIEIYSSLTESEEYNEYIIQLVNKTNDTTFDNYTNAYDPAIFNAGIKVRSDLNFCDFELNSIKHYYAENPEMIAIGANCSVKGDKNLIETENVPRYEQKRIITIDKFNNYIEFEKLMSDPVNNLLFIYKEMEKKLNEYKNISSLLKSSKTHEYINAFNKEIEEFEFEIKRFKYGIDLINNKSDVKKSFYLMNKVFSLNKKGYKSWRMFQIVFIVSEIADIIYSEYKDTPNFKCNDIDNVDLIYFPTGGGKTETFLGCCVFTAFFDRIRGKNDGTTAIIKYPLRLLAAQQLDRILELTIISNKVKKEERIGGEDFSVGFYTGSKNTPNKIKDKEFVNSYSQETMNNMYRQIDICPICHSPMNIYFDDTKWELKHMCSNHECNFVPPIYIVDDEIYRRTPTFIVSTIDKMANIGTSSGFRSLLGQVNGKCKIHGYSHTNNCQCKNCKEKLNTSLERKDPIPTLFIQDELHLVSESLGTFDSHYESLIQYYCSNLVSKKDRKKIKYIGATATISDYKKHIKGLYNKDAKKFPTSVKKENFYSKSDEDDISRILLGTALYGDSVTNLITKVVTLMRIIICEWMKKADEKINSFKAMGFSGNKSDLKEILNYYLISIIYNNSKNDSSTLMQSLQNQGNNRLISEGIDEFNIAEITGDVDFKDIKTTIHNVESDVNKFNTKNLILATSSISHGVDEDFFNQIYFFGMPNNTSEYIQAYSRVGRKYTGIVFDIIRLVRDRDKSYLNNFYNFHRYSDQLISPVPINRYAKNAIYSTLPGVISALLMQHYIKEYYAISVRKAIDNGILTYDNLINDLKNIYDCDNQDSVLYEEIIEGESKRIFTSFASNTNSSISIPDFIKSSTTKRKGPMTSLRDVDIPLLVEMKGE